MRAKTAIALLVGFSLWGTTSPAAAQIETNDFTKGPMGAVTLRLGVTNYGSDGTGTTGNLGPANKITRGGGGVSAAFVVQPLVHSDHVLRAAYVDVHLGHSFGDSHSSHKGIEFGARGVSWERERRLVRFSIAGGLSLDRWDVFARNEDVSTGTTSIGASIRPALRLWRFELSVPLRFGTTFAVTGARADLDGNTFSFWGLDLGFLVY